VYQPNLELLQQVFGLQVIGFEAFLIKQSFNPSGVYRVVLQHHQGHPAPGSVILKFSQPGGPGSLDGADRECLFYERISPDLPVNKPKIYFTGLDDRAQTRLILMEDLTPPYFFPSHPYQWTPEEFRCVLRAYARLHAVGGDYLPHESQRGWMLSPQDTWWKPEEIPALAGVIVSAGLWPSLPKLDNLVEEILENTRLWLSSPATLLHYDAVPPNVALPENLKGEAVILDWQDATWGVAELDIAYLFNQPFSSARHIDRQAALRYYWTQRQSIDGLKRPIEENFAIQRLADITMAFSLIYKGHQAARHPYPQGTYPRLHWDSQFGILYDRLQTLCNTHRSI
jgi:hypothetical protein